MTFQSGPVGLDHSHKFKLALLLQRQDVNEGLVEHSTFWQFSDDPCGLPAAWRWDVDLLGEPDVTVLQSKESLVGSQPHLKERRHQI